MASSVFGCKEEEVQIYNLLYKSVDEMCADVITSSFHISNLKMVESSKQDGRLDCGLYAIANSTTIAHGINPKVSHMIS